MLVSLLVSRSTNNSHRAQRVSQDVKEDSLHDLTASSPAPTVAVAVTPDHGKYFNDIN